MIDAKFSEKIEDLVKKFERDNKLPSDLSAQYINSLKLIEEKYKTLLNSMEGLIESQEITPKEIYHFTEKVVDFFRMIENLPEETKSNLESAEQLKIIKEYAGNCADVYATLRFERINSAYLNEKGQKEFFPSVQAANVEVEKTKNYHNKKIEKYRKKRDRALILNAISGMLIITWPLVPYFMYRLVKQSNKAASATEQVKFYSEKKQRIEALQESLTKMSNEDATLLTVDQMNEKAKKLQEEVRVVKQKLGVETPKRRHSF